MIGEGIDLETGEVGGERESSPPRNASPMQETMKALMKEQPQLISRRMHMALKRNSNKPLGSQSPKSHQQTNLRATVYG